jgi:hypothetical protein
MSIFGLAPEPDELSAHRRARRVTATSVRSLELIELARVQLSDEEYRAFLEAGLRMLEEAQNTRREG